MHILPQKSSLAEVSWNTMSDESSFCFLLRSDATLKEDDKVHIQLAVLYTTAQRERRVRVHNLCLMVSAVHSLIFKCACLDTVASTMAVMAVDRAMRYVGTHISTVSLPRALTVLLYGKISAV